MYDAASGRHPWQVGRRRRKEGIGSGGGISDASPTKPESRNAIAGLQ